jgi:hypothetical protein
MAFKRLLLLAMLFFPVVSAQCAHTLNPEEQKILEDWLTRNSAYRVATDADCNCPEDIQQMKAGYGGYWKPVPDYHPYIATGDFNSDGVRDFAVVVIDRSRSTENFTLLVFNGPFGSKPASPAFVESRLNLRYEGLAFGPPRPKPYRLLVGPFESDNTWILVPRGRTYKVQVNEDH